MVEGLHHPGAMAGAVAGGAMPGCYNFIPIIPEKKKKGKKEAWQRKASCCCAEMVRAKPLKILPVFQSHAGCPTLHPGDTAREGINTCQCNGR